MRTLLKLLALVLIVGCGDFFAPVTPRIRDMPWSPLNPPCRARKESTLGGHTIITEWTFDPCPGDVALRENGWERIREY